MLGGIYTNQKCSICGSSLKDDRIKSVCCPIHPEQKATHLEVKIRGVSKRFNNYSDASRFLTGLRYKIDEGSFDARDYRKDNPLGFANLIEQWIEVKRNTVRPSTFKTLKIHAYKGIKYFGNRNIKEIGYADLENFIYSMNGSDKTRHNVLSVIHGFFVWLQKRRVIDRNQFPEFPHISFEMKWRKTVNKETQVAIIEEVKRLTYHLDPKIWLGVKWLATYYNVRPGEMVRLKEGEIDLNRGYLFFPNPKEKKPKWAPLIEEDIELLKSMTRGLPFMSFFRHPKRRGVKENKQYSDHVFKDWWSKACKNLEIDGVDLYGGTRHSTAIALKEYYSPEVIKRGSGHYTSKAFERYFQYDLEDKREIYRHSSPAKELRKNSGALKKGKLLKLQDISGAGDGN